jgi:ribonuclease HI
MDDELAAELLRLETAIAARDEAALDGGYAAVLHEAFGEIGASGRHWSRAETLALLNGAPRTAVEIREFHVSHVADGVVLALYETGGVRPARRSSLWVRDGGRWRLRFHQGTPP